MEMRPLGKTGFEVSALGFGGAPVGFDALDQQAVAGILNTMLDRGVNLIDTAAAYKGSEEAIGEAVGATNTSWSPNAALASRASRATPGRPRR